MENLVTCANCGERARAGRTRCGRCGSSETTVVSGTPQGRTGSVSRLAIGGGMGLVAIVAVGLFAASPDSPRSAVESVTPTGTPGSSANGSPRPDSSAPELSPHTAADSSRFGAAAYNNGDLASAAAHYAAAVEADPNDAAAQNNLGQLLVRTGRPQEALAHFDKAIEIDASAWSYHFNRARAYAELRSWPQAIAGYEEAARLFPHDYATQFNLAKARQAAGDLAGAIDGYAKAIELAPGQADFHLSHGLALEQAGRQAEAVAAYQRFLEMEPDSPQADKVKARLSQLGGGAEPAKP